MHLLFRNFALALLLVAAVSAQAVQVGVDRQKTWVGFMNWLDMPADGGAFRGQGFWAAADLAAQFSGASLTLSPNTSVDRDLPTDPYWWKPDGRSNKIMSANLFVVDDVLAQQSIVFSGRVSSHTLAPDYLSRAFIRAFSADFGTMLASTEVLLEGGQAFQVVYQSQAADVHIEYGFETIGPDARLGSALGSVVIATVPEPSAMAMLAAGLLGLLGVVAIRRRAQRA